MRISVYGLAIGVLLYVPVSYIQAAGEFQNYDNDPVLEKAWQYDGEHTADRTIADPAKAVEFYLEYLKRDDLPSFQRAKVYVQLAVQYTTLSKPDKGLMPDRQKARRYLEKALELEPQRIGLTTIRARSFLASVLTTREETVSKDMENYEWLLSLGQARVEELALPIAPGNVGWLDRRRTEILNYAQGVGRTTAINTIASVKMMKDKEAWFEKIIERFPDTEMAEMARKEVELIPNKVAEAHPQPAAQDSHPAATSVMSDANAPAVQETLQASSAVAAGDRSGRSGTSYLWLVVCGILGVIVACLWANRTKKKCSESD